MFQQHHGESLPKHGLVSKAYSKKSLIMASIFGSKFKFFYDHVSFPFKWEINYVAGVKLRDKSVEDSWEIIDNLALYDHESWNGPRDFAKLVKAISLPQDVPKTSDRRLLELEE
ncbi:hypothetical protein Tco_1289754 [Tanacetum coccineum]